MPALDSARGRGETGSMGLLVPTPVSPEAVEGILAGKLRWILAASDPLAVIVFGSAARGEMTEVSDIDLALVYPDAASLKAGRAAIFSRPPPDSWPVDLLFHTKESFLARRAAAGIGELIAAEGRLLHGRIE